VDETVMHFSMLFGDQKQQSQEQQAEKAAQSVRELYLNFRKAGFDDDQSMKIICAMIQATLVQK